eukprot:g26435.t1
MPEYLPVAQGSMGQVLGLGPELQFGAQNYLTPPDNNTICPENPWYMPFSKHNWLPSECYPGHARYCNKCGERLTLDGRPLD